MFCAQCGTSCPPEFKFCKSCGVALPQVNTNQQSADAAPAAPHAFYPAAQQVVYYTTPQAAAHAQAVNAQNLLKTLRTRLQAIASTEDLQGFSLTEMFSEVFKHRSPTEFEDYLLVGTSKTTPPIDVVETGWPRPWLFFRILAFFVIVYVALTMTLMRVPGTLLAPGVMIIGSFAVPLATMTLFFEMNTPRNVSVQRLMTLLIVGATVSLFFAGIGYNLPFMTNQNVSLLCAGVVEECAKLAAVIIVIRNVRYKYILNGLLFGATVGAGFASFETAGYAMINGGFLDGLIAGLQQPNATLGTALHIAYVQMIQLLRLRAFLAPFGHVAWTAIAAGALWRLKKDQPFRLSMLGDTRFLKAFMIPVCLHTLWDFPFYHFPYYSNFIVVAFISWYIVFGLVQQGLRQVQDEQRTHLQTTLNTVEASLQTATPNVAVSGAQLPA